MEITRPTLLSSCALATTSAEAKFRVEYPNSMTRTSRIFALDEGAARAMSAISEAPWNGAHFLTVTAERDIYPDTTMGRDLPLCTPDGIAVNLLTEIDKADVVVLISSSARNGGAAEVVAREAYNRKIMIAGLVLGGGRPQKDIEAVVNTLRPFASVLVVANDDDFITAMLTALRA